MITVTLTNTRVTISGARRSTIRKLDKVSSYYIEGAHFSRAFKRRVWDGIDHLLKLDKKTGDYSAPAGLVTALVRALRRSGVPYRVENRTVARHASRKLAWNPEIKLRDYQREAIRALMSPPLVGSGILKMPIRSGKTKTAAGVIRRIGRPALFITPSKMLLHQTRESLRECFPEEQIGIVGDGENAPETITVASVQTLYQLFKRDLKGFQSLVQGFDVVILDEAHHATGKGGWTDALAALPCKYRIGLSATAFPEATKEASRGAIWMIGVCGPVRIDIPMSELVETGYLMRQHVRMIRTPPQRGKFQDWRWSKDMQTKTLHENKPRNKLIALEARAATDCGLRVVIVCSRHNQIAAISEQLDNLRLDYNVLIGATPKEDRDDFVSEFISGYRSILIGTVLGEGVDIPTIEVVINAEGGKDQKATIQRQRNLTVSEGKTEATFIDFWDQHNDVLKGHSKARRKTYEAEESFVVEIVDPRDYEAEHKARHETPLKLTDPGEVLEDDNIPF